MISARKRDIPNLADCDRRFTHEIISARQPDAFTVQLEHVDPNYKFITAAEVTRSNNLLSTRIRTFPNDFQVAKYFKHFPFGKRDYVTIIDENLGIVYITTTEAQCQIMELDDYKSAGIDYSRVLAVAGQYYGPTYSRDLPSKRAYSGGRCFYVIRKVSYSS